MLISFRDSLQKCKNCFIKITKFSKLARAHACVIMGKLAGIAGKELYNLFSIGKAEDFTVFCLEKCVQCAILIA